ncbi:MAG: hypothetical protein R3324_10735 [Halobacteriales archaeon]|nr:hypothetical protein [Halobacteriales archaeon]
MGRLSPKQWFGFVAGMGLTSASLSTGFIWACGAPCVTDPVLWTPARQTPLVFGAALTAWWGYLIAHYAVDETFVNRSGHSVPTGGDDGPPSESSGGWERPMRRRLGVLFGIGILVLGMVFGVVYIGQGDHLMTNVGGALFLGGYAIAHHVETGKPV